MCVEKFTLPYLGERRSRAAAQARDARHVPARRGDGRVRDTSTTCPRHVRRCPLAEAQLFWYRRLLLKDSSVLSSVEATAGGSSAAASGAAALSSGSGKSYKSLMNLLMQLRKCCDHPFLFDGAEDDPDMTSIEELVGASGKLRVLDRLLLKLHAGGHRVVLFSQFASMVDLLDDYCKMRGWNFLRLTGSTNR